MKLNPYLKEFWKTKSQIKCLYGGRMSSKTEDTAGILIYLASKYKIRVACLRRFQNKISESVYKTLQKKIDNEETFKNVYRLTDTSIKSNIGSEFVFLGIQRNLEEIKGLDDIDITWIEEAEKLTEEQWNIIRPTILRKENSFCILVFNPSLETDFVYREFVLKKHSNVLTLKINYEDNPFLSNSAKSLIEVDKNKLEEDEFNHIYKGYPKNDSEDSIIKRKWIEAAIDAHIKLNIDPTGLTNIGYDVADSGNDENAITISKGILAFKINKWKANEDELRESALKVYTQAKEFESSITYDSIGVGAGVGSNINEFNKTNPKQIKASKFIAGDRVKFPEQIYKTNIKNKDMFANLKAQAWWNIADRFRNTFNAVAKGESYNEDELISISSSIEYLEDLIIELTTPKKDFDLTGKVKVESKQDLLKRGIKSPNIADSFIMSYQIPIIKKEQPKINNTIINLPNFG